VESRGLLRIVHPYEALRINWDTCVILAMLYTCFELPFRFGFSYRGASTAPLEMLTLLVDCFFLLDCALNFRTGYEPPAGRLKRH
jgi:hypothetical protein